MEYKLSILIPSTIDRQDMLDVLLFFLLKQVEILGIEDDVEILTDIDNREISVGEKRQRLLLRAKGEWVCYIDSDDEVSNDYIFEIIKSTETNPDVITFNGWMTTDGVNRENFKIAQGLPYITIKDANGKSLYLRHPNHLTPVRRSIAIKIGFKDLVFAEDYDYSFRLKQSELIETSCYIEKDLYHYKYIKNK